MKNTESALKAAGLGFGNAVMMHVFLDDPGNYDAAMKVYGGFFKKGGEPAIAVVPVDWIPGDSRVLVTCWAVRDMKKKKVIPTGDMPAAIIPKNASPAVWAGDTSISALEEKRPAARVPMWADRCVLWPRTIKSARCRGTRFRFDRIGHNWDHRRLRAMNNISKNSIPPGRACAPASLPPPRASADRRWYGRRSSRRKRNN